MDLPQDHPGDAIAPPRTPAPPTARVRALAIWRLLTLRRVPADALPHGPLAGIVGGVLAAALWIALDARRSAPLKGFEPYAFTELAWFALGALGIAALMNLGSRWRLGYARALDLVGLTAPALAIAWLRWEDVAYGAALANGAHGEGQASGAATAFVLFGICAPLTWSTLLWLRGLTAGLGRAAADGAAAGRAAANQLAANQLAASQLAATRVEDGIVAIAQDAVAHPYAHAATPYAACLWALVGLAALGAGSTALGAQARFWYTAEGEAGQTDAASVSDAEAQAWARANALLFSQPARIDAAIAKMPAATPGPPRAWFLGFAGDGDQRVFANEIGLAQRVLGQRFGTGTRALALLNDRRDVDRAPLASASALRHALQRLGARMNRDKDVLVLALSSHGGEDATLAVRNGMLPFEDLSATVLADALAKSGIRWRVIIVSACHAGSFIPALKDAHTIVIAAAAPDRSSFGCADDRDLTYFGEAFYRDALPAAPTLRAAFDIARRSVERRELAEGFTPSRPVAWFGPALEAHLARVFTTPK